MTTAFASPHHWLDRAAWGQVDLGVDPGFSPEQWCEVRTQGLTVLHVAVRARREDLATAILGHAPHLLDTQSANRRTPLMEATVAKAPALVALLLERGADPALADLNGLTPWGESRLSARPVEHAQLLHLLDPTLTKASKDIQWPILLQAMIQRVVFGAMAVGEVLPVLKKAPVLTPAAWIGPVFSILQSFGMMGNDGAARGWAMVDFLCAKKGASLNEPVPAALTPAGVSDTRDSSLAGAMARVWKWDVVLGLLERGADVTASPEIRQALLGDPALPPSSSMRWAGPKGLLTKALDALELAGVDFLAPHKDGMTALELTRPGVDPSRWEVSCWLYSRGLGGGAGDTIDLWSIANENPAAARPENLALLQKAEAVRLSRLLPGGMHPVTRLRI